MTDSRSNNRTRASDGKSRTFRFFPEEWALITRVAKAMGLTRTSATVKLYKDKERALNRAKKSDAVDGD